VNIMRATKQHLANLRSTAGRPWFSWCPHLLVAGLALFSLVAMFCPMLTSMCQYDRSAIQNGQWWRMLTGHLTHWNVDHWIWDWSTFVALSLVALRQAPLRTVAAVLGSALAISCSLWCWLPDLPCYRGLSGLDTALFTFVATEMLVQASRDRQRLLAGLVLLSVVGLVAKTGFELCTGGTLFVDSTAAGFETITLAHAIGALVGMLACGFQYRVALSGMASRWRDRHCTPRSFSKTQTAVPSTIIPSFHHSNTPLPTGLEFSSINQQ
jgi:rhomboid family GlyGly-CTERM serine protease